MLFTFLYKLAYIIIIFLSATLITLTTKCKTNLILDKTNKINSLQKIHFVRTTFVFVISLFQ